MDPLKKAAEDKCLSFETIHKTLKESEILRDESLKLIYRFNPLTDKPEAAEFSFCLLYTSPSPRDVEESRMPSSA